MTIYTIVPLELIYIPEDESLLETSLFTKNGITFIGEKLPTGSVIVNRLVSTNPNDYMQDEIVPGNIILN